MKYEFIFCILQANKHTIHYKPKRGKIGLVQSKIGLNITVSRALFAYGKIHIKCVGIIEDGILQGFSNGKGNSHEILNILLPEQLKVERPPAEFVGELNYRGHFIYYKE